MNINKPYFKMSVATDCKQINLINTVDSAMQNCLRRTGCSACFGSNSQKQVAQKMLEVTKYVQRKTNGIRLTFMVQAGGCPVGCVARRLERRSLAGELSLSCASPAVDG